VGLILWSIETIRDEGINIATALYLMGMTPVWDKRDKVAGVKPIPGSQLNRPRIDVLLQMSGLFRDTFPSAALLLDKAVKEAATLTDLDNFIREHSKRAEQALAAEGYSTEEARKLSLVRLFSARPGAYGTKVADMTGASGLWENDDAVAEEGFINTVSFGYSNEIWGERLTPVYRRHLRSVDATVHSISSNLYSTMDNDDMFQYLGGLSMAVQKESGEAPDVFVSLQRSPGRGRVEPLAATLGKELRTRYLNPGWIEGMKKEGYAGAREMSEFAENMWGWQVTVKDAVDSSKWRQVFEVYVEDKYEMDLDRFFDDHNPWAYQSLTARMLEAVRKGYWQAEEETVRKLSAEYAVNVIEKGVACCDHTCNNPMLNQMVANIISLPGVLSLEMVDEFKLAVEQASAEPFDRQTEERVRLLERLDAAPGTAEWKPSSPDQLAREKDTRTVEGYKMEDMDTPDETTTLTSSGVQWAASLFVAVMVCLFMCGLKRRK
jgi:cobaltochelatase CobN